MSNLDFSTGSLLQGGASLEERREEEERSRSYSWSTRETTRRYKQRLTISTLAAFCNKNSGIKDVKETSRMYNYYIMMAPSGSELASVVSSSILAPPGASGLSQTILLLSRVK